MKRLLQIATYCLMLIVVFSTFSCKNKSGSSLYDYISNMQIISTYDDNKTIEDFDTIILGSIEQYDDRNGEKQGIEWLLMYRDNDKALLQSKYIIAIEPYSYEYSCPTYEEYLKSDSYEEYNEIAEWVNSQFDNYKLEFNKNSGIYKQKQDEKYLNSINKLSPQNDRDSGKSPFIYDWLDNTFINVIFNNEEQKIIKPLDVTEYNYDREEIIKTRKLTLMTFEDSEKYYGKLSSNDDDSFINNKIRTKATKAVDSFVKNFDNEVIYKKGGVIRNVRLKPDEYYLNTKRTNDEAYIQGAHDAVIGIRCNGFYDDIEYYGTFSSTSNVFGGGDDVESIGIAGVRPCMWIDLKKANSFIYDNKYNKYEDDMVERKTATKYDVNDRDLILIKSIDEYNDDDTIEQFDTVQFGKLNDKKVNSAYFKLESNDTTDIELEWIPLEKTDNYILLLSKYVLFSEPYNKDGSSCSFEESSLCEYLNSELINSIFSDDDKKKLIRWNNFDDKMFIINEDMIKKYFSNSMGLYCPKKASTKVLPKSNLKVNGSKFEHNWNNYNSDYLIDSYGDSDVLIKYVDSNGEINNYGTLLDSYKFGIRPAIYLDLNSVAGDGSVKVIDQNTKELKIDNSKICNLPRASISELKKQYANGARINMTNRTRINKNSIIDSEENIFFGRYEQDGDLTNGEEDIEWNIIARDNGKVLLLSKYIIESEIISNNLHLPIYDDSVVRTKLIGEYYDKFFSNEEKAIIESSVLNNFDCPLKRHGKNKTYKSIDKLFLLSIEEIRKYFGNTAEAIDKLKSKATYYVTNVKNVRRRINDVDIDNCFWLRSPGSNKEFGSSQLTLDYTLDIDVNNTWSLIDGNGHLCYYYSYVESDNSLRGSWFNDKKNFQLKTLAGVRPALWVDEIKLIEYSKKHKINQYVYEDRRNKKSSYEIKDIDKVRCLSDYDSSYSYNDFDTVVFGKYAFENNTNSKKDLEWFVLDKSDDKAVLISKYVIDDMALWEETKKGDEYNIGIDVENTECFNWLNNDFFNESFSDNEKSIILKSSNNLKTFHYGYGDTDDFLYDRDVVSHVFLLNKYYANKYFTYKDYENAEKKNTDSEDIEYNDKLLVAKKYGQNKTSSYWLMENIIDDFDSEERFDFINEIGMIDYNSYKEDGLRPLIVIDTKSLKK